MIDSIRTLDLNILAWIASNLHCAFLDKVMPVITMFGESGIFWIAVAVVLVCFKKTRKVGLMLGLAFILGLLIGNCTLKPLIGRIRPYNYLAEVMGDSSIRDHLLVKQLSDFSFPSGHTLVSFEAASVLMMRYRKPWGWIALVLGICVAFSRLYLYVHYPSDVLTGLVMGTLFGVFSVWFVERIWKIVAEKHQKKIAAKANETNK